MMTGYIENRSTRPISPRQYRVVASCDGWCVALGEARTTPFKLRKQAERIAATLQQQADALRRLDSPMDARG